MADYSDRALRAFVEGIRAARSSDERPDAGVLDTTGPDAPTGSDETGRSDAVPKPHHHNHRAAIDILDYRGAGDNYVLHLATRHNDDGSAKPDHDDHPWGDKFHDSTAVYDPAPTTSNDAKPVRDARAHIKRTTDDNDWPALGFGL